MDLRTLRAPVLMSIAALLCAVTLFQPNALAQTLQPVGVDSGMLQGRVEDGLAIYRGIPFAAPPVGNLRWRPPQPVAPWRGVRAASEYGRACMQSNPAIANLPPPSEDCLFLNVWTPRPDARGAGEACTRPARHVSSYRIGSLVREAQ